MADFNLGGGRTITDNAGDDTTNSTAVAITAGGSTKGSWTELVSSTASDTDVILIAISHEDTGAEEFLLDLGVGSSGNEEMIVEDLYFPGRASSIFPNYHMIPVAVGEGVRVSCRIQGRTSRSVKVQVKLLSSAFISAPGFGSARSVASDAATDVYGIEVDPGGTANTKGSWTELVSSTADDIHGFLLIIGFNDNATNNTSSSWLVDIAIGAASSEQTIISNHWIRITTSENNNQPVFYDIHIPSGTRIAARAQCTNTDATDRIITPDLLGII